MKLLSILVLHAIAAASVAAQETAVPDTITAHSLDEIVIEAPKVIRKSDMDVYHPSASAVANSSNGLGLLRNLMIPTLTVNEALGGSITASGQPVQIRINGRIASIERVRALLPGTIRRVEWIDNPGLKYGDAAAVLNFIVSNPAAGGSLMAQAQPALNEPVGFYFADLKLNNGYSQWNVTTDYKLMENVKIYRDYTETFTRPDGSSVTRDETPLGGRMDNSTINTHLSYSYTKPDTTIIVVEARFFKNLSDLFTYEGLMRHSDGSPDTRLTDSNGNKGITPRLSFYWEQHLRARQTIAIDAGCSFYSGHSMSDYNERIAETDLPLTQIHNDTHDRNLACGIEADYIKHWRTGRLTAGASYSGSRNRTRYDDLDSSTRHQRQDRLNLFIEYFARLGRWTATGGIGAQYTSLSQRETGRNSRTWSPRPNATVTYAITPEHNLRLSFASWLTTPSLSETDATARQVDATQWHTGNPDLRTAASYRLKLRYGFTLPRVNGSLEIRAFTSPHAIAPTLYWEGDRLITTYENSRGRQNLSASLATQIDIVPRMIVFSGNIRYRAERMRGSSYQHCYGSWSGNAALQMMYRHLVLTAQYSHAERDLNGERITWGENLNLIDLSYNIRNWQIGAGILMPIGDYDQGSRSLSRWNSNERHMRLNMKVPYIQVSYNLQWGRHSRGTRKLVNADATAERSAAASR